jgi:glutaredoxin
MTCTLISLEETEKDNPRKKSRHNDDEVQISLPDPEITQLMGELSDVKKELKESEKQRIYYVDIIREYKQINKELKNKNASLSFEIEKLKEKLNTTFDDQQTRIDSITKIAQKERRNLYNDLVDLMEDKRRFQLDSLLEYTTSQWLSKRNPVIVRSLETLTHNDNENSLEGGKLFKCAVAVDAIYGARNLKYVSAINLASSAIKYSIAKSKKIIDVDNHFLSSGSFFKFLKWQEDLAGEQEPLPKGLLFMAFDNEQKGQKNYLDRSYNTVTFHTVTSFVGFNFDSTDKSQALESPWLYQNLNKLQMEELFDITPAMQSLIDQELNDYLTIILAEASTEKNSDKNIIDELASKHNTMMGRQKRCDNCGKNELENVRRTCPHCNKKLKTLTEIQQDVQEDTLVMSGEKINKSLTFKFHEVELENLSEHTNTISTTQISTPQAGVKMPDIFVPDPLPINPNSVANVRKVLEHIQEISGIAKGERKWIVVTCDGVPYHYAQKIKNDFPGILLIPGPLHEEMNMLKSFVELNWYVSRIILIF